MTKNDTVRNDTIGDTIACIQCRKEFTSVSKKARFCSEACKQKNKRDKRLGDTILPPSVNDTIPTGKRKADDTITKTDQLFVEDAASRGLVDWYKFDEEVFGRDCWQCKSDFRTRLKMNRYCSPKCRNEATKIKLA